MPVPASDWEHELALAEHERREAVYEARQGEGERPSMLPPPMPAPRTPTLDGIGPSLRARDKLPTFDDLTSADETKARPARWRLVLALVAALGGLGELARQIATLVGKH